MQKSNSVISVQRGASTQYMQENAQHPSTQMHPFAVNTSPPRKYAMKSQQTENQQFFLTKNVTR